MLGFPCGSAAKESACNAGDLGSIPGLGRSPGEGIGYPLQYFGASLVAQTVNLPAILETWVWSLRWKDPWKRAWQATPVFLPGESRGQRSLVGYGSWGCRVTHDWATKHSTACMWCYSVETVVWHFVKRQRLSSFTCVVDLKQQLTFPCRTREQEIQSWISSPSPLLVTSRLKYVS